MKLLYLHQTYTSHDHRMLTASAAHYDEVIFMRLDAGAPNQDSRPLPDGVREVAWKPANLRGLRRAIVAEQPDLIHAGPLTSVAYLAAQTGFHPLVVMSWGWDLLLAARDSFAARSRVKYALSQADVAIGDCRTIRDLLVAHGMADERIVTFPWGVNLEAYQLQGGDGGLRAELGWQEAFVLLHVRGWAPLYGVEAVARAFVHAAQTQDHLRLLMPGTGSLAPKLRRIFLRGGVLDRVHLPGNLVQSQLPDYFRAADLYIANSHSDGSSVSLMEALASGLPALVSDIPGNLEWVQDGQQGWTFPLDDVDAIAAGIETALLADLDAIGKRARQTAEARADWRANQKGLIAAQQLALELARG
jgi:glycosyltransferase involved in cell wall biosynthesis